MAGFFQQLMARPSEPPTRLSRYTEWCGYAYAAMGTLIFLWPDSQVALGFSPPFQGQEQGLVRTLGFVLLLIGYFYVFGGRTHRNCFGLAALSTAKVLANSSGGTLQEPPSADGKLSSDTSSRSASP